jgi:hypothetical protein
MHYYGIRHHGPGCARALKAALDAQAPDIVLLEGPPEADALVALAADPQMSPPVALLVYPTEAPQHGVFYPFTEFSPEWQAIQHALARQVPLWFMDLPPMHGFAEVMADEAAQKAAEATQAQAPGTAAAQDAAGDLPAASSPNAEVPGTAEVPASPEAAAPEAPAEVGTDLTPWRMDPIGELSRAAGYDDQELWWEIEVEQRRDASELFTAIAEAMTALREHAPVPELREARREAHMRSRIRDAQKAGYQNIAVVCGAWHLSALMQPAKGAVKADAALLKGLPKTRVAATWVPWSDSRLASASGYGAGVTSPGWYRHLWHSPDQAGLRWVVEAARLIRDQGLDASSASVIETVRLADALAALRGLPLPGLKELREAILTVLCHGETTPLELIRRKLEVGDRLGHVPATVAAAPLQRDLEAQQKRLRLKPSTEVKALELDLREDGGRERSRLLHRLHLLGVDWGTRQHDSNRTGTFRETWELRWQPELVLALIDASRYGNTLEDAASHRLCERARASTELPELTALLDDAVLARLPVAITVLLACVQNQAAVAADMAHLMEALPPLARVARYGDVRGTDAASVQPIVVGLVERITVGLAPAASGIDEASAGLLIGRVDAVQVALDTLELEGLREDWFAALANLATLETAAPAVRGFGLRLLFDRQRIDADGLAARARLALAPAVSPAESTSWLAGLLRGSGLLLLHHDALWRVIDEWLQALGHEVFLERLPLLRRAFADFTPSERRQMGDKVKHLHRASPQAAAEGGDVLLDGARAALVLPVLAQILGDIAPAVELTPARG